MLPKRSLREWISSLPVLLLLLMSIFLGTSEMGYSQLLKLGEYLWKDYYILRGDIPTPTCNPNPDIETELQKLLAEKANEEDEFGGLFGEPEDNTDALRESLQKQAMLCAEKHSIAEQNQARVTDEVRMFRQIDYFLLKVSEFGRENQRMFLGLMLFFCAFTTTLTKHHIGLRLMTTQLDYRVGSVAMTIANACVTYSAYWFLKNGYASGTEMLHPEIRWLYLIGFGSLTALTAVQCFIKPKDLEPGGTIGKALLSVPLYAYMAFISTNFYIIQESNPQGMVLFIDKIMDAADMFIKIGLYIWIGMLLKQTYIGELVFRVFKPWRLPPEMLAFVAVVLMAVPTAYTGASGIIVIAMGAVVYNELRRAGSRRQLALAATAMTGSLGVVLRPCLLVVIIAALNKEVTTDQLFGWGVKIFILSSFLFFVISLIGKESKLSIAPVNEALKPSLSNFQPLIPYAVVFIAVAFIYGLVFDAYLDEFSAPTILPVIILALLIYEKLIGKPHLKNYHDPSAADDREIKVEPAIRKATTDTTGHIGALLTVMALGITVGGVIEDSGVVSNLADQGALFSSQWTTMAFLCLALVLIGMSMDAFAAVILVSGSIAQLAYQQGIDPLHFWMLVLVAFELGYLTPPVAINHLLTRQVVGEEEFEKSVQETQGKSFWRRHERLLLPLAVMFTAMLIVAFTPLIYNS
ncbi:MAG: TRAP transporter large permease subunit [Pseudomonadales bacterium]|nr:TRAP transporter large permease subunit [Pseudomonadales bacterium]